MSKRKNRTSSPNLPQATLDRARQQLGSETPPPEPVEASVEPEVEAVAPEITVTPAPKAEATTAPVAKASTTRSTRRRTEPVQAKGGRKDQYDLDVIKNRLEHPTRVVTEAELRQEYSYVIRDLRSMFALAAVLIVVMIVLAQIL